MKVKFRNNCPSTVWVAIMRYAPDACGRHGGNWTTAGWWEVNPGGLVHSFNTTNRYAAFYAEANDGTIWTGPYGPMYIYWEAFDACLKVGRDTAYDQVGLRLIDLGSGAWNPSATYTVTLRP